MKMRELGDSGIKVSEICLGSWLTYGVGVDTSAARACVDAAFDAGINFIDTANVYGRGAAETFLGDALKARPRDSYVMATKLYFPMSDTDQGLSRAQIFKQVDFVLARAVEFTTVDTIEPCREIEMREDTTRVNMRLGRGEQQSIIPHFQIGQHFRNTVVNDVFEQASFRETFAVQHHRQFD